MMTFFSRLVFGPKGRRSYCLQSLALGAVGAAAWLGGCTKFETAETAPTAGAGGQGGVIATTAGGMGGTSTMSGAGGAQLGNGEACGDVAQCASGFCTDGVCCDMACEGPCRTCAGDVAGATAGACHDHDIHTNPEGGCMGICDGVGTCAEGTYRWHEILKQPIGTEVMRVKGAVSDSKGNTIVALSFFASLTIGGDSPIPNAGASETDIALVMFSPTGEVLHVLRLGDGDMQAAGALAIDSNDKLYLGGSFKGDIDFNGQLAGGVLTTSATQGQGFVAKFDVSSGAINYVWSKGLLGTLGVVDGLSVTATGDVWISYKFRNTIDLTSFEPPGPGLWVTSAGGYDTLVFRINPAGKYETHVQFGGQGDNALVLAAQGDGSFVAAGTWPGLIPGSDPEAFGNTIKLGENQVEQCGHKGLCAYVAWFDAQAALKEVKVLGNTASGPNATNDSAVVPRSVAVDEKDGRVVVAGHFNYQVDLLGTHKATMQTESLVRHTFVAAFSSRGQVEWSRAWGTPAGFAEPAALHIEPSTSNVFVSGEMRGNVELTADSGVTLLGVAGPAIKYSTMVLKLHKDGSPLWARAMETAGGMGGRLSGAMTQSAQGVTVVSGFYQKLDVGTSPNDPLVDYGSAWNLLALSLTP